MYIFVYTSMAKLCYKFYNEVLLEWNKQNNSSHNGFAFHYILMQNLHGQRIHVTWLGNLNAK
jgi:hypothetical protein